METLTKRTLWLVFILVSSILLSCGAYNSSDQYTCAQPEETGDGLETASMKDVNIDAKMIEKAVERIAAGKYREVHSMLIYKNGKLVVEEYFSGHKYKWDGPDYHGEEVKWDRDMDHQIMSCTKSFTSACIGIAINKGFIGNENQSIFDYLPDYQYLKTNNREYIKIENLLTMTSGLAWDEWSAPHGITSNDIDRLYFDCDDPVVCVLERPWWAIPGDKFTYNGGGMVILGQILKNATGMNIDEFSKKYLFAQLGIKKSTWSKYPNGMIDAAGSLRLTPREMLKLGILYLNDGVWNNERILPEGWVKRSSEPYRNNVGIKIPIEDSGKNGYGYSWWTCELQSGGKKINMYRANGWGGQVIMVFPEQEMVVVFTSGNYATRSTLFKIISKYVLPAVY